MSRSPTGPSPAARQPLPALDGLRLLAVEDHAIGRVLLDAMLGGLGIRPTLVGTGEEARAAAEDGPFDVVLVDLGLPDIAGERLAGQLASLPGTREARIVALTGRERPTTLPAVFHDWIQKPFSARDLYDHLRAARDAVRRTA